MTHNHDHDHGQDRDRDHSQQATAPEALDTLSSALALVTAGQQVLCSSPTCYAICTVPDRCEPTVICHSYSVRYLLGDVPLAAHATKVA